MKTFLVILVLFFSSTVVAEKTDNLPPINTEHEVYMGDKMVEQRTGYFLECIVPNFDVNYEDAIGQIIIIKKDVPMCKETKKSKFLTPEISQPGWEKCSYTL